jgi:hypothetical protein
MDVAKSEGEYTIDQMQQMATVASTADGLNIEGNNFKVCALTGSPDMLLFACERIKELESVLKYYKYECSGYEPSISVFQRMVDEAGI